MSCIEKTTKIYYWNYFILPNKPNNHITLFILRHTKQQNRISITILASAYIAVNTSRLNDQRSYR